jgi:hypothetical protein
MIDTHRGRRTRQRTEIEMTDTTPDTTDHATGMAQRALRMALDTITGMDDDWEQIAKAQIEAAIDHAAALADALAEAERQRDYHRDDAAMVRRERSEEIALLLSRQEQRMADERARADRLRKALKQADSRVIQYAAEQFTRNTGALPPLDWFRRAMAAQESNHYAVDGLQPGDLDGEAMTPHTTNVAATKAIIRHTDALADALASERARNARLREAFDVVAFYGMPEHCEEARSLLQPGDLDEEAQA